MRLFWLIVLACFMWISTHEAAAHAGVFSDESRIAQECPDGHAAGGAKPGNAADAEDDHHHPEDRDSHGHFRGAVDTPVKPVVKTPMVLGTPVVFDSTSIHPGEQVLLTVRWTLHLPAQGPPRYLSAHSLLL